MTTGPGKGLLAGWSIKAIALTALLVLAFLSQALLVQTHVHFRTDDAAASAATTVGHQARDHRRHAPDDPDNCPICQDQSAAGDYILPPTVLLQAPLRTEVFTGAILILGAAFARRSHAWRSRAPPLSSQT